MALAYWKRIGGDRTRNLEDAIECFHSALEVRTPLAFPEDCLQSARNLGDLGFENNLTEITIEGYTLAIDAVEQLHSQALSADRKAEIIADAIDVYSNLVQTYINLEQYDKAIEIADRSKARNLVDLIATKDLYPSGDIPTTVIEKLDF